MENNNKTWIPVVIVIILLGVVFFVMRIQNKESVPVKDTTTTTTTDSIKIAEPESVQDVSDQPSGAVTMSYANALVKYADRRIQLDTTCQAHPNNVTYKDNTGIMIDNRSPKTRTVKVVDTNFIIKPYGFKIVVLPDIYLKMRTLLIDCDKSQNVATILVQE